MPRSLYYVLLAILAMAAISLGVMGVLAKFSGQDFEFWRWEAEVQKSDPAPLP